MGAPEHCGKAPGVPAARRWAAVGLLLTFVSGAAFSQGQPAPGAREYLSVEPPPGWKLSHRQAVPGLDVVEFMPQRQALEDWRDMITALTISGNAGESPAVLMREIAERARPICLQVLSSPINEHVESGYPAATMSLFCLRDAQTRMGDVTLYRAIRGERALYVLSRSRRGETHDGKTIPLPEEILAQWRKELRNFLICRRGDAGIECSATY